MNYASDLGHLPLLPQLYDFCTAQICKIKNKFALPKSELVGGYCDFMFCVIFQVQSLLPLLELSSKFKLTCKYLNLKQNVACTIMKYTWLFPLTLNLQRVLS